VRILIGAALLRVLVKLLIDEVLVVLTERRVVGSLRDALVFGEEVVEVQFLFLHSL
jgi:hypothetical protein